MLSKLQQALSTTWKDTSLYKRWAPGLPSDLSFTDFWTFFRTGQFPPNIMAQLTPEVIAQVAKAWVEMGLSTITAQVNPASTRAYFNAKLKELFPEGGSHE